MSWKGMKPSRFALSVEKALTQRQKDVAAFALQQVIVGSPVDQGAYKGNHRVTVDGITLAFDPERTDKDGSTTLNDGLSVIGGISRAYGEVVIQNNAPYAQRLENGWSDQGSGGDYYAIAFNSTVERFR